MAEPPTPHLLFVGGAGDATLGVDAVETAIRQARKRGLRIHITNQEATLAATPTVTALADAASVVDFEIPGESVAWAREQVAAGAHFDIVFGVREMAQEAAAEVADGAWPSRQSRRTPSAGSVPRTQARAALVRRRISSSRASRVCADAVRGHSTSSPTHTGPLGGQAARRHGQRGREPVSTGPDQLRGGAANSCRAEGSFIAEEFVDGPEYSVGGVFFNNGVPAHTRPHLEGVSCRRPYFFEIEIRASRPILPGGDQRRTIQRQVDRGPHRTWACATASSTSNCGWTERRRRPRRIPRPRRRRLDPPPAGRTPSRAWRWFGLVIRRRTGTAPIDSARPGAGARRRDPLPDPARPGRLV